MHLLHLEDNRQAAELVRDAIQHARPDLVIRGVATRDQFLAELSPDRHDLILSSGTVAGLTGADALRLAREHTPATPLIFVSDPVGDEQVAALIRAGAADFVLRQNLHRLPGAVDRALREQAELARTLEAQHRTRAQAELLDQARDGIVVSDLHDHIVYWNRGAERLFGWTSGEVIGQELTPLFGPAVAGELSALHRRIDVDGTWFGELALVDRRQRPITVELRANLIFDDRVLPRSRLLIITDISERKTLEAQLHRGQRLESLGMLAAGIAHDLNNILAPVLMGAPMLRSLAVDTADAEVINAIEKSATRGAALVRQILAFAQGRAGTNTLMQPKHLVHEVADLIQRTFPKSITLQTDISSQSHSILGNPTQLHQVLLNLCVNARDAMPQGGTLRLAVADAVLTSETATEHPGATPGSYVVITVSDTGTGIPPEILPRIWEPFYTTKDADKGTGLGLSTVRGIVANHRGFVQVESTVGAGSIFRLYLPAAELPKPASNPPMPRREPIHRGRGELLLVVDDESNIRSLLAAILRRDGYRVVTAANGVEAVALISPQASTIKLVITDLAMPEMGGLELADQLLVLDPGIRVLFMSGAPGIGPRGERQPPIDRTIGKPFSTDELLTRIRTELDAG